jgi:26S proteasome regulatory subunit N10
MEATMVCIDNSEWTRSGDYAPTRFQAQADAVNLLAGAKTQANPEATVGVLTMSGRTPRILVTPTPDLGKVLNCMTDIPIEGEINVSASVQIAQLALKHRQNKNQRQRIVIFTASPIQEDKVRGRRARDRPAHVAAAAPAPRGACHAAGQGQSPGGLIRPSRLQEALVKIAKKLKKNNVAVDIVSFGELDENEEKVGAAAAPSLRCRQRPSGLLRPRAPKPWGLLNEQITAAGGRVPRGCQQQRQQQPGHRAAGPSAV